MLTWILALALHSQMIPQQDIHVDLMQPTYENGVLTTTEGGVVTTEGMRVQARHIIYDNRPGSKGISAEGDLLVQYGDRYFVGERLEYHFDTRTGELKDGRTFVDLWFMGGERIILKPDKSYQILGAYATTSTDRNREWEIHARRASIRPDGLMSAKRVQVRALGVPILPLPSLKANLNYTFDSPVRYTFDWTKGQGPRLGMRYRIYSWETIDLYSRLEFRPDFRKVGIAGALEGSYLAKDRLNGFSAKNFITKDTYFNDTDPGDESFRFRSRGMWRAENSDQSKIFRTKWDWFDDKNLPLTLKTSDFEHFKPQRTELYARHQSTWTLSDLSVRPRINSFQGFKQELPAINFSTHPVEFGSSGVIFENSLQGSYLDYTYSNDIDHLIPNFNSLRFQSEQTLYRTFHTPFFSLTPLAGFSGILYDNSPGQGAVGQAIFRYEGLLNTKLQRYHSSYRHLVEPYLHFQGLTSPTTRVDEYFVYGITDGYNRLNALRMGLKNTLHTNHLMPTLFVDLYAYAFFNASPYKKLVPKSYADILWNLDRLAVGLHGAWNFEESVLDYSNLSLLWTINRHFATYFELRHRSRFDWRKNVHQNFILDVTRPIESLLETPISDGRNTFLSRLQFKLHPEWILRLESHQGWGRKNEPSYNEGQIQVLHMLTSSWRFNASLAWTVRTDGLTWGGGSLSLNNAF